MSSAAEYTEKWKETHIQNLFCLLSSSCSPLSLSSSTSHADEDGYSLLSGHLSLHLLDSVHKCIMFMKGLFIYRQQGAMLCLCIHQPKAKAKKKNTIK